MSITINPLHELFAAEMLGVDVRHPDTVPVDAIEAAVAQHAVVVLRGQTMTDDEQIAFSRLFGPLELPPDVGVAKRRPPRIARELYDVSNLDEHGELLPPEDLKHAGNRANEEFHTDSSFNSLPTKWSLLSARIIPPEGADTLYADARAAYDALPDALRARADGAIAEHDFWNLRSRTGYTVTAQMRAAVPPVRHPVVRINADSGRASLYLSHHATHIVGWPPEEGAAFLRELTDFATQPRFVYRHRWQPGDFVIWDNRSTLHRGTSYDVFRYKRDMRRTTINEYGPERASTDPLPVVASG